MKFWLTTCLLLAIGLVPAGAEEVPGLKTYDQLVRKYASMEPKTRGVRYKDWKANAGDMAALRNVLDQWAKVDPRQLSGTARQAFYINLYNATILEIALRHYPIKTVTTIGKNQGEKDFSIFSKPVVRLNGKKITLNELEQKVLMSQFPDERNHFAVNCASASCPPLANFAYEGKYLEDQIKFVTQKFISSSQAFKINSDKRQIQYSKIFEWYKQDFEPESAHRYISRRLEEYFPPDYEEIWMDYDWSLNDASK